MRLVTASIASGHNVRAPAQLIGAHGKIFGDLRDVFIRRVDDLAAEDPREGGLRHAGTPVKLRGEIPC